MEEFIHLPRILRDHLGVEAQTAASETGVDNLLKTVERAAADEENVGCIDLNKLLVGVLPSALRRHRGNRALQNF